MNDEVSVSLAGGACGWGGKEPVPAPCILNVSKSRYQSPSVILCIIRSLDVVTRKLFQFNMLTSSGSFMGLFL